MQKWIKIESEDDLPKELNYNYFVLTKNKKLVICYFSFEENIFKYIGLKTPIFKPTHYQRINYPVLPIEE